MRERGKPVGKEPRHAFAEKNQKIYISQIFNAHDRHLPLPNWIFYEESPDSRTSFENVSVTVPIVFDDGQRADVRFWPLCYFVSTLTFYALLLLFRL